MIHGVEELINISTKIPGLCDKHIDIVTCGQTELKKISKTKKIK